MNIDLGLVKNLFSGGKFYRNKFITFVPKTCKLKQQEIPSFERNNNFINLTLKSARTLAVLVAGTEYELCNAAERIIGEYSKRAK
jgi:hypothetical protein